VREEEVGARTLLLQGGALELSCERLETEISEGGALTNHVGVGCSFPSRHVLCFASLDVISDNFFASIAF
jgi:hypothetical protein